MDVPIVMLNSDCLIHIFEYLPLKNKLLIERVCCKWKNIVMKSWNSSTNFVISSETILYKKKIYG